MRTLLLDVGVIPLGDGDDGADDECFNFFFEGGISLPWSDRGTGSPSRARYTRCIAYNTAISHHPQFVMSHTQRRTLQSFTNEG